MPLNYLPNDDLIGVETCRRNTSDKWLFITDHTVCWIKYCAGVLISL